KGSNAPDNPESMFSGEKDSKKNRDMFYNKRAQYYTLLSERFRKTYLAVEKKQYIDPDELISIDSNNELLGKLRAELCGIPRVPNGVGKVQLMRKADMKKKLNRDSPNMADCLAMAMEIPQVTETVDINFEGW
ncbi:MAG: terminase large subunit, partial [Epibacterium sp.]|nr:terminase large subunit [Epibacterium sp.]NQX75752.1 PBSX family phage terminase large subunit [Epibacterium sp.]